MDLNNKNDIFENTLLLGNVKDRIKLLMQTGQIALAYMSAKAHNLVEFIPFIEEEIRNREIKLTDNFLEQVEERSRKAKWVLPWRPVFISNEDFTTKNWPYTMLLESNLEEKMKHDHEEFYDAKAAPENAEQDMNDFLSSLKEQKAPEPEIKSAPSKEESKKPKVEEDDLGGQNWEGGIDIDADILNEIGVDEIDLAELEKEIYNEQTEKDNPSSAPPNPLFVLVGDSVIPAHHIAVGNFEKAVELLKNQIGLWNPLPLKDSFDYIFNNTKIDSATWSKYNSMNEWIKDKSGQNSVSLINLEYLKQVFKEGFTETTSGNFGPALTAYQKCIQHAAVSLAMNSDEEDEIKRLINNCVEYIIAMRIELKRRDKAVTTTEQDNLLLAMLMSVWKLHPSHSFLVLNNAMNWFYKAQNFVSAAYFAEQILNLESKGVSFSLTIIRYLKINPRWLKNTKSTLQHSKRKIQKA